MKVNVFNMYKIIKDKNGYTDFDEELLEKLDAMLNQVGIAHAFAECRNEELEADENAVVTVMYNEEDDTKFFLTYALFCQTFRGLESEQLKKAMLRHAAK